MKYPVTPDGRYFLVRGRLWRMSDPSLDPDERTDLTKRLMDARRAVRSAKKTEDADALNVARRSVDRAKVALGERGRPWWTDGAPDFNRHFARNTPYQDWFQTLVHETSDKFSRPA